MQDESYTNHEASFDPADEPLSPREGNSADPNDPFPATKGTRPRVGVTSPTSLPMMVRVCHTNLRMMG